MLSLPDYINRYNIDADTGQLMHSITDKQEDVKYRLGTCVVIWNAAEKNRWPTTFPYGGILITTYDYSRYEDLPSVEEVVALVRKHAEYSVKLLPTTLLLRTGKSNLEPETCLTAAELHDALSQADDNEVAFYTRRSKEFIKNQDKIITPTVEFPIKVVVRSDSCIYSGVFYDKPSASSAVARLDKESTYRMLDYYGFMREK